MLSRYSRKSLPRWKSLYSRNRSTGSRYNYQSSPVKSFNIFPFVVSGCIASFILSKKQAEADELLKTLDDKNELELTEALLLAIKKGDIEAAANAIQNGANFRARDDDSKTFLQIACSMGNLKVVKWLLENGYGNLKEVDINGVTAFLYASQSGNKELVEWMLHNGACINDKDDVADGVMMKAAMSGNLELVKFLEHEGVLTDEPNYYGVTPLLYACYAADFIMIDYFLEKGADVNVYDNGNFESPLLYLCDYPEYVSKLIDLGANVNHKNILGITPLIRSVNNYELVKILLTAGANVRDITSTGENAAFLAVAANDIKTLKLLINHGAEYGHRSERGSILLYAGESLELIKYLHLVLGLPLPNGMLAAASVYDNLETLQFLLDQGVDINDVTHSNTALSIAAENKSVQSFDFLLEKGAILDPLTIEASLAICDPDIVTILQKHIDLNPYKRLALSYNCTIPNK